MNGLLLVDKPCGMSSFDVVRRVRRWTGTRQVGHCGTLDPSASGVLPIAIGSTTRLVEYLMAGTKEYLATMRLGMATDTQDGEGNSIGTGSWERIDRPALDAAVQAFTGEIRQIPPMYSALKRDGIPLYRLARQGLDVQREARTITIDSLQIVAVALPDVTLQVTCGKGTYIRTLCHDLGLRLGCLAHLVMLRRVRCGPFSAADCHSLAELEERVAAQEPLPLLSSAAALGDWPGLQVLGDAVQRLAHGIAPRLEDVSGDLELTDDLPVRLLFAGRLAAVARYAPGKRTGRPGDFLLCKVFPEALSSP